MEFRNTIISYKICNFGGLFGFHVHQFSNLKRAEALFFEINHAGVWPSLFSSKNKSRLCEIVEVISGFSNYRLSLAFAYDLMRSLKDGSFESYRRLGINDENEEGCLPLEMLTIEKAADVITSALKSP